MRILWITNITFPEAESMLLGKAMKGTSGGWLLGASEILAQQPNIKLFVASISKQVKKLTFLEGRFTSYYLLPYGKGNLKVNHDYDSEWRVIKKQVQPDVVHIHGSEFTHGLSYVDACGADKVCLSIQGMVSEIGKYFMSGITWAEMLKSITPASLITGGIRKQRNKYRIRGKYEIELISKVKYLIGRTKWDKAHVLAINANSLYFNVGETLRREFYDSTKWNYDNCTPHSIFLSQSYIPLKGLHMVLKAMPIVLQHYPDTIIRVAGHDITRTGDSWISRLKMSDYGNYLRSLVSHNKLMGKVSFIGSLNADEMKSEYLNANVFVCPSSVENSPNSLGEAQLLGVPVVASYVGGIPDMMKGGENYLYRFDDIELLAHNIIDVFDKGSSIDTEAMRKQASIRHNPDLNLSQLLGVYNTIANNR